VAQYEIGNASGKWPEKAYKNLGFLNSPPARSIRIVCEYLEPATRFDMLDVKDTVVFFGSARTLSADEAAENLHRAEADQAGAHSEAEAARR